MIIATEQQITLPTYLPWLTALNFIQNPGELLSHLDFLTELKQEQQQISGIFAARFPLIGAVTLPFSSQMIPLPTGAQLSAQPLPHERAWLEILGLGTLQPDSAQTQTDGAQAVPSGPPPTAWLHYHFQFRAHLQLPTSEQWGTRAFEKMVQASAQHSIARVVQALPQALEQTLREAEKTR